MSQLPADVRRLRNAVKKKPSHALSSVARQLCEETPELVSMWLTIERHSRMGDPVWVQTFLYDCKEAFAPSRYQALGERGKQQLREALSLHGAALVEELRANDLDVNVIHNEGELFNGFFFYEEFGESNKASIDRDGLVKLSVADLIEKTVKRAVQLIDDEPWLGKQGANADAIRFLRRLGRRNLVWYDQPLNGVLAVATNTLFETVYAESDVVNLLHR